MTIEVPQAELDDLHERLGRVRWPVDPGNLDGRYGAQRSFVEDLVTYWRDAYDWRAVEAEMNTFDHQRVVIDGIPIHFMRVPGHGPDPTPIVLTHGWPWTFWDLRKVAVALADPASHGGDPADSFDVIIPSLPGYGFSVPLEVIGVNIPRIAELWVTLMRDVLGYERFAAQGGDWGAFVTAELGHAHAQHLIGVYLTMGVIPAPYGTMPVPADAWADDEQWMRERLERSMRNEPHLAVHGRDPQTFSYAMADSPAGMAAWLWHRRDRWCDGNAIDVFGPEDLCTQASLYWFNNSFTSSIRLYAEVFKRRNLAHDRVPVIEAPTGIAVFPKELMYIPRSLAESHTNLHRWASFDSGGHFAPVEQPDAVITELRDFFRDLRD